MAFAVTSLLAKAVPDYFPQLINPDPTAIWRLSLVGVAGAITAGELYLRWSPSPAEL